MGLVSACSRNESSPSADTENRSVERVDVRELLRQKAFKLLLGPRQTQGEGRDLYGYDPVES